MSGKNQISSYDFDSEYDKKLLIVQALNKNPIVQLSTVEAMDIVKSIKSPESISFLKIENFKKLHPLQNVKSYIETLNKHFYTDKLKKSLIDKKIDRINESNVSTIITSIRILSDHHVNYYDFEHRIKKIINHIRLINTYNKIETYIAELIKLQNIKCADKISLAIDSLNKIL